MESFLIALFLFLSFFIYKLNAVILQMCRETLTSVEACRRLTVDMTPLQDFTVVTARSRSRIFIVMRGKDQLIKSKLLYRSEHVFHWIFIVEYSPSVHLCNGQYCYGFEYEIQLCHSIFGSLGFSGVKWRINVDCWIEINSVNCTQSIELFVCIWEKNVDLSNSNQLQNSIKFP